MMATSPLHTCGKTLSVVFGKSDLSFTRADLVFGLICTWLAGMGRYWDHPEPEWFQRLGLGSVIYVFALSALLWLLFLPMRFRDLSYRHLLTLVALTAPLAFLYAIPVERWVSLEAAQSLNAWFLAIVAIWRVAIYLRYLYIYLEASAAATFVLGLLPLCGIVASLATLNLEKAVFQIMAGLEPPVGTSADLAYEIVFWLGTLSILLVPLLLMGYLTLILIGRRDANRAAAQRDEMGQA